MRFLGLDVHRDFCEVAIAEDGMTRSAGKIKTSPAELQLFARSLAPNDVVAMEATANALAITRIDELHVARVVLANPKAVRAATGLRAKTDKIDARTLAQLLAAGFLAEVWTPDEQTRVRPRLIAETSCDDPGAPEAGWRVTYACGVPKLERALEPGGLPLSRGRSLPVLLGAVDCTPASASSGFSWRGHSPPAPPIE